MTEQELLLWKVLMSGSRSRETAVSQLHRVRNDFRDRKDNDELAVAHIDAAIAFLYLSSCPPLSDEWVEWYEVFSDALKKIEVLSPGSKVCLAAQQAVSDLILAG